MKKLVVILGLSVALVACNNEADSTARTKDSLDSIANVRKDVIDSSADARKDIIDSTTEQKKEALDRLDSLNRRDTAARQ
ncbi:MAG: hypothetical protein M3413_04685 [Bacteroidota bacterium]|nr:hypothetical protein [Bacteroidota bacterium]